MKISGSRKLLAALLALVLVLGTWAPAFAASAHVTFTDKSVGNGESVEVGDEFTVTVGISSVSLATLTGGLHFDTDLLKCTDVEIVDEGGNGDPMAKSSPKDANSNGNVGFVYLLTANKNYNGGAVLTATFEALKEGSAEFYLYEDSAEYVESGTGSNDYKSDRIASSVFTVEIKSGTSSESGAPADEPKTPSGEPETPPEGGSEAGEPGGSESGITAPDEDAAGVRADRESSEPGELDRLSYSVFNNGLLTLSASDIDRELRETGDERLDFISIELPPKSAGTLYYDFVSGSDNGGLVRSGDALHRTGSGRSLIGDVTFVPVIDYTGSFDLDYTAYGGDEGEYEGTIRIRVAEPESFTDTVSWNYDPAKWGAGRGIAQGYGGGIFAPNDNCTWGHILTFLWRAYGSPDPKGTAAWSDAESWNAKAIQWAAENGIADSESSSVFGAKKECTRAQALQFIYKAAGSPSVKGLVNEFADVSSSAGYLNAVIWGVDQGITNGTGENGAGLPLFSPDTVCTRGHIITFLYRAIERQGLVR